MPSTRHLPSKSTRQLLGQAPQTDVNDLLGTYNRIRGSLLHEFILNNAGHPSSPSPSNCTEDSTSETSCSFIVSKSHSRRREPGHIPRPPNAFLTFRSYLCVVNNIGGDGNQRQVSKDAGKRWEQLDAHEKERFKALSENIKAIHTQFWPKHRYNPAQGQNSKSKATKKGPKPRTGSLRVKGPELATSTIISPPLKLKLSRPLSPCLLQTQPAASISPSSHLQGTSNYFVQYDAAESPVMLIPDDDDMPDLTYPEDDLKKDCGSATNFPLTTLDEEMTPMMSMPCHHLMCLSPERNSCLIASPINSESLDSFHGCSIQLDTTLLIDEDTTVIPSSEPIHMDVEFTGTTSPPFALGLEDEDPFSMVFPALCAFPREEYAAFQLASAVEHDYTRNEQWFS